MQILAVLKFYCIFCESFPNHELFIVSMRFWQMEAAKAEKQRMEVGGSTQLSGSGVRRKTEIIREYQTSDGETSEATEKEALPLITPMQPPTQANNSEFQGSQPDKIVDESGILNKSYDSHVAIVPPSVMIDSHSFDRLLDGSISPVSFTDSDQGGNRPKVIRVCGDQHQLLAPTQNVLDQTQPAESIVNGNISLTKNAHRNVHKSMNFYELDGKDPSKLVTTHSTSTERLQNGGFIVKPPEDGPEYIRGQVTSNPLDKNKPITFTNSQNVGMTYKVSPPTQNKYGKPATFRMNGAHPLQMNSCTGCNKQQFNFKIPSATKSVEPAGETSLKHTCSLRMRRERKIPCQASNVISNEGSEEIPLKSLSTDSIHNLELVEDSDVDESDISSPFKPRKIRKRKKSFIPYARILENANCVDETASRLGSGELKTVVISIVNKEKRHEDSQPCHSRDCAISSNHPSTEESISVDKKPVIVVVLKPELIDKKKISIKDEIEPNPRPERTQSVRSKTRRRSSRKSNRPKLKVLTCANYCVEESSQDKDKFLSPIPRFDSKSDDHSIAIKNSGPNGRLNFKDTSNDNQKSFPNKITKFSVDNGGPMLGESILDKEYLGSNNDAADSEDMDRPTISKSDSIVQMEQFFLSQGLKFDGTSQSSEQL